MNLARILSNLDQIQADLRDHRITEERCRWLGVLIAAFSEEHDWNKDEDPSATSEMLHECRMLSEVLERQYHDAWAEDALPPHVPTDDEIPF